MKVISQTIPLAGCTVCGKVNGFKVCIDLRKVWCAGKGSTFTVSMFRVVLESLTYFDH